MRADNRISLPVSLLCGTQAVAVRSIENSRIVPNERRKSDKETDPVLSRLESRTRLWSSKNFQPEMEMECLSSVPKPFLRSSDQSNSGKTDEHGNLDSHSMLDLPARGKR
jgi:hypothetical protein